jgi:hypothetical protein
MSLELAEKLNNYLNIYRIDKSSEPPACRGSKIRQMRSRPSKDAALWHKSGVKRVAASSFPDPRCGKALWEEKSSFRNLLHESTVVPVERLCNPLILRSRLTAPHESRWQIDCCQPA